VTGVSRRGRIGYQHQVIERIILHAIGAVVRLKLNRGGFECPLVNGIDDVVIGIGGIDLVQIASNYYTRDLWNVQKPNDLILYSVEDDDVSIGLSVGIWIKIWVYLALSIGIWSAVGDEQQMSLWV